MLPFESERVRKNAQEATTEDLLNRVTVYREGMEPQALSIIEAELVRRGVSRFEVSQHEEQMEQETLLDDNGIALRCSFCHLPAVAEGWGWHRLWGRIPIFPEHQHWCREHQPENSAGDNA